MDELELLKEKTKLLLRFNPNHGPDGKFAPSGSGGGSSGGSGKSGKKGSKDLYQGKEGRNYGKADTSDALKEVKDGNHNSLEKYMDENGNLTPERAALHKQIIDDYLAEKTPVEGQAEMVMMGGGPASGKSSTIKAGSVVLPDEQHTVMIDPDDIKKKLPGYSEMARTDDSAASFYHEESSMIAKQLAGTSFDENYNVVYDGTGNGSERSVMKKINGARENGYRVTANYVTVDTDEAVIRNQERYDRAVAEGENPRLVPESYVRACHASVTDISMATAPEFDSIQLFDNNGSGAPVLIATGGSGQPLTAVPGHEAEFEAFVRKGNH